MADKRVVQVVIFICSLITLAIVVSYSTITSSTWNLHDQVNRLLTLELNIANKHHNGTVDHKVTSLPLYYQSKSYEELWTVVKKGLLVKRVAYYDLRDKDHFAVQIISLLDRRNTETHPTIYAKLYYYYGNAATVIFPSKCYSTIPTVGSHTEKPGGIDDFIHFLITIPDIPSSWSLSYATVSLYDDCNHESVNISITTINDNTALPYNYGVCLHKAILDEVQPQVLLDWIKLNLALGAETITLYLQTVPDSIINVLRPYVANGTVELLDWKVERAIADSPSKHAAQTGVIADCIYHNMNRVRYLAMTDLDEFIIPQNYHTIPELIEHLNRKYKTKKPVASYVFWSANMHDNGTPLPIVSKRIQSCPSNNLSTVPVYFKRTQSCMARATHTRKMIVRPMGIKTSWVHNLLKTIKGYEKELIVPEEEGVMRHYRFHWKGYIAPCRTPKVTTFIMEQYVATKNTSQCASLI